MGVRRRHLLQAVGMGLFAGCSEWGDDAPPLESVAVDASAWTHFAHDSANTNHAPALSNLPTREQWRVSGLSAPAVTASDGRVYVVRRAESGEVLTELDRASGTEQWTARPERAGTTRLGLPTMTATTVYVPGHVERASGSERESETERQNPERFVSAFVREDGSRRWTTRIEADALVRVHPSGVVVVTQHGPEQSSVVGLDATTGEQRWRVPREGQSLPLLGDDDRPAFERRTVPTTAIVGDDLYVPVVDGDETQLRVLDVASGTERTRFTVPVPVEYALVAANGLLYGTTHSLIPGTTTARSVYAIDPENEALQWSTETTDEVYRLGVSDRAVYFADDGVRCLDSETGTERWRADATDTYPAILGEYVTALDSSRLRFHEQATGEQVADFALDSTDSLDFVAADEQGVYAIAGETLYRFV